MFDRLLFMNAPGYGPLIDIGALAESLIFYGHVELICNSATLEHLVRHIPPDVFLTLLKSRRITAYLLKEQIAIHTLERAGKPPIHRVITIMQHQPTAEESAERALLGTAADRLTARKLVEKLQPLGHGQFGQSEWTSTFLNGAMTGQLALTGLRAALPSSRLPPESFIKLHPDEDGFVIDTNLNFIELNDVYHRTVPESHSSITPAWLIALVKGAQEDMYFASTFRSEIATRGITSAILSQNVHSILQISRHNQGRVEAFSNVAMDSGNAIQAAINSGAVPFAEMLDLLERADRFRDWLADQPPDADLVKEYYRATIENTWIEKLPGKSMRWAVFTGLGLAADSQLGTGLLATAIANGLSIVDAFFLDKLIGGWKPHHFIEQDLKAVLRSADKR